MTPFYTDEQLSIIVSTACAIGNDDIVFDNNGIVKWLHSVIGDVWHWSPTELLRHLEKSGLA